MRSDQRLGHFRTPVEKGLEIIEALRGHTTGYATPIFVVDAPGGGGKILLVARLVVGRDGDDLLLRNFEGKALPLSRSRRHARRGQGHAQRYLIMATSPLMGEVGSLGALARFSDPGKGGARVF